MYIASYERLMIHEGSFREKRQRVVVKCRRDGRREKAWIRMQAGRSLRGYRADVPGRPLAPARLLAPLRSLSYSFTLASSRLESLAASLLLSPWRLPLVRGGWNSAGRYTEHEQDRLCERARLPSPAVTPVLASCLAQGSLTPPTFHQRTHLNTLKCLKRPQKWSYWTYNSWSSRPPSTAKHIQGWTTDTWL